MSLDPPGVGFVDLYRERYIYIEREREREMERRGIERTRIFVWFIKQRKGRHTYRIGEGIDLECQRQGEVLLRIRRDKRVARA